MSRYIDADALDKRIYNDIPISVFGSIKKMAAVREIIAEQPTVDAVPMAASDRNKLCPLNHGLRCKDIEACAFWCEWGQCAVKAIAVACADGERRTNGEEEG